MPIIDPLTRLGAVSIDQIKNLPASGAYALVLRVKEDLRLQTGVHGRFTLPAGNYVYAGRATKGLASRLARHRKRTKPVRWHIDRLTVKPHTVIEDILVFPGRPELECEIVRTLLEGGVPCPVPHFGNSDCREGCPAHLVG